ncbi:YiiD C-terminal domain-containing protein [Sulfurovum lithotrophicum]|uniref:YiiD C-terminal domain-containing protein n=1 Tax=Sulfurovum lithotrophicum TaxID=206403 RepID=UPI000698A68A|nr:YiiD C-terminal domain-containing protein [Sulfurovum lithotrophicum]
MTSYTFPQFPKHALLQKVKDSFVKRFLTDKASIRYLEEGFIKATDIPFVRFIGIKEKEEILSLDLKKNVCNHVETIHAAAQFTLAETESGMRLQSLFPELEQKVIPLVRDAQIKYKKPAAKKITAHSFVEEEAIEKFKTQFGKKGRALLQIRVEIRDIDDTLTSETYITWFVQARLDENV